MDYRNFLHNFMDNFEIYGSLKFKKHDCDIVFDYKEIVEVINSEDGVAPYLDCYESKIAVVRIGVVNNNSFEVINQRDLFNKVLKNKLNNHYYEVHDNVICLFYKINYDVRRSTECIYSDHSGFMFSNTDIGDINIKEFIKVGDILYNTYKVNPINRSSSTNIVCANNHTEIMVNLNEDKNHYISVISPMINDIDEFKLGSDATYIAKMIIKAFNIRKVEDCYDLYICFDYKRKFNILLILNGYMSLIPLITSILRFFKRISVKKEDEKKHSSFIHSLHSDKERRLIFDSLLYLLQGVTVSCDIVRGGFSNNGISYRINEYGVMVRDDGFCPIIRITGFNFNVDYSNNEKFKIEDHPTLCRMLRTTCRNDDDIKTMLAFIASCCLGKNLLKKALFMYGDASTGKSLVINIINAIIGNKYVASVNRKDLAESFGVSSCINGYTSIISCSEFDASKIRQEEICVLKSLVSDDYVSMQRKHKNAMLFKADSIHLVLASNTAIPYMFMPESEVEPLKKRIISIHRCKRNITINGNEYNLLSVEEKEQLTRIDLTKLKEVVIHVGLYELCKRIRSCQR